MSELRLVRGVLRFGRYAIISSRLGQFITLSLCDHVPHDNIRASLLAATLACLPFFLIWPFQQKSTFTMGIPLILYDSLYICMDRHPVKALKCCMDESIYCTGALNFTINAYTCTVR